MTPELKEYISVSEGMAGWFAVHVWWNPEGFWEPYQTGVGRYKTRKQAIAEAKSWSQCDGIPLDILLKEETK